jgi:hypothetical protein
LRAFTCIGLTHLHRASKSLSIFITLSLDCFFGPPQP